MYQHWLDSVTSQYTHHMLTDTRSYKAASTILHQLYNVVVVANHNIRSKNYLLIESNSTFSTHNMSNNSSINTNINTSLSNLSKLSMHTSVSLAQQISNKNTQQQSNSTTVAGNKLDTTNNHTAIQAKTKVEHNKMKIAGNKIDSNNSTATTKPNKMKIAGHKTTLKGKTNINSTTLTAEQQAAIEALQQRSTLNNNAVSNVNSNPVLQYISQSYDLSNVTFLHSTFQRLLTSECIGRTLIYLPSTTSTMDVSKLEGMRNAIHGTAILAEYQSKGRGRGDNRVWKSNLKGNLYFTILLRPMSHSLLPVINFAVPLAVCIAIKDILKQYNINDQTAYIKWYVRFQTIHSMYVNFIYIVKSCTNIHIVQYVIILYYCTGRTISGSTDKRKSVVSY